MKAVCRQPAGPRRTSRTSARGAVSSKRQPGAALIIAVMLLVVMMLLGLSAARIVLESEKLARNEQDRLLAFHAAEAGLRDAEFTLARLAGEGRIESASRPCADAAPGEARAGLEDYPDDGPVICVAATDERSGRPGRAVWQAVDFAADETRRPLSRYGQFTGARYPAGDGSLPAAPPRYLIERVPPANGDAHHAAQAGIYRITAMGYGMRESSQVVLQSYYRERPPARRISWREIPNWRELHEAAVLEIP